MVADRDESCVAHVAAPVDAICRLAGRERQMFGLAGAGEEEPPQLGRKAIRLGQSGLLAAGVLRAITLHTSAEVSPITPSISASMPGKLCGLFAICSSESM